MKFRNTNIGMVGGETGKAWALEDVGFYLKVTETTVVSWVKKGILLGGKQEPPGGLSEKNT